jgi:hypothetical protein
MGLRASVSIRPKRVVLMAFTGAVGVALLWAVWRSRGVRAFLNRPRAWWMRMLVVFVFAMAATLAILLVGALKFGGVTGR